MRVKDILTIARLGLCRNKLLSAFLIAGMTAGVVTTGLVVGFGMTAAEEMLGYGLRVPADRIAVLWTPPSTKTILESGEAISWTTYDSGIGQRGYLLASDAEDLKREMPGIKTLVLLSEKRTVYLPNSAASMIVAGTTREFSEIIPVDLCAGSFFTDEDLTHQAPVCLITKNIAEREFGGRDPVGAVITVAGHELTIIGVIRKAPGKQIPVSADLGRWRYMDSAIVVPWTTIAYRMRSDEGDASVFRFSEQCPSIMIALASPRDFSKLKDTVTYLAGTKWRLIENAFKLQSLKTMVASLNREGMLILIAVFSIASIALVVACLNSVNFSVASVAERRKEIGIRKALGATDRRILLEVVLEVAAFGAIAGMLAVPIVYVAGAIFNEYLQGLGAKSDVIVVNWSTILFILFISVGAAALAGLVPARAALKVETSEALQVER
jgi:putative ABC transport system permease protein